jgi:Stigma-specific protein, Stig1
MSRVGRRANTSVWRLRAPDTRVRLSRNCQVALILGMWMASFVARGQPLSCPTGQSACGPGNGCVNTSTDVHNCGGCGNTCAVGQACAAGMCVSVGCPAGQALCAASGSCVNITNDPQNCGNCGNVCAAGQACTAGVCQSPAGNDIFACEFNAGKLAGNTIIPSGITLAGPAGQSCSNHYGSSGVQVRAPFACAFTVGRLAGETIVPTDITLTGPAASACTDNYGSSGTQVLPAQN